MTIVANHTWHLEGEQHAEVKRYLLCKGGQEGDAKGEHEDWKVKYCDATFIYYKSGTLYGTESDDESVAEAHDFITQLAGSKYVISDKKYLMGFDEVGKGEVLGPMVLAGVVFDASITRDLELEIGTADTKKRHPLDYWVRKSQVIQRYCDNSLLHYHVHTIQPSEYDKFNANRLLDMYYQKALRLLSGDTDMANARLAIDDYCVGETFRRYVNSFANIGTEVVCET